MIYTNMNPLKITPKFPMTVLYLQFILICMHTEVAAQCLWDYKNLLAVNMQTCHLHSGVEPSMWVISECKGNHPKTLCLLGMIIVGANAQNKFDIFMKFKDGWSYADVKDAMKEG